MSDESVLETITMLRAEKQGHQIFWDQICFAEITLKNGAYSSKKVILERAPFFHLIESLEGFLVENWKVSFAREDMSCIDQFYGFRIEKEDSLLLFSRFAGWEKWKPVKIRHEGMEKEIQRACRQFLKDYCACLPMLLNYSRIHLIKTRFDV